MTKVNSVLIDFDIILLRLILSQIIIEEISLNKKITKKFIF